jgi:hypothetical protein|tara:strand:+ start:143 stop:694 length:552 start_codon:yes stop_codon:yes gene_type:complete
MANTFLENLANSWNTAEQENPQVTSYIKDEVRNAALLGAGGAVGLGAQSLGYDPESIRSRIKESVDGLFGKVEQELPPGVGVDRDIKYLNPAESTVSPSYTRNGFTGGLTVGAEGITDPYINYNSKDLNIGLDSQGVQGSYETPFLGGKLEATARTDSVRARLDAIGLDKPSYSANVNMKWNF